MRGLKRLLVPVVVTAALVGLNLPAGAKPVSGPFDGGVTVERWSRSLRVPTPMGRVDVASTAISNRGHIAVAYRDYNEEDWVRGYVIVRSPGGEWGAPHRLNPPDTDIGGVEVAFDRAGNLTAFWAFAVGPEGCCGEPRSGRFRVATKPAGRAWSAHLRTGMVEDAHWGSWLGLSVAPSGRTAISWWRSFEPGNDGVFKLQFTVRVRSAADAPWGRARALSRPVAVNDSRFGSRDVHGDVAISNDGSATAVWGVYSLTNDGITGTVRLSTRRRSGAWTAPAAIARNAGWFHLATTPAGFTGITWIRPNRAGIPRTVVVRRTPDGIWSREIVRDGHVGMAVGPRGKLVLIDDVWNESSGRPHGLRVSWRSNRSDWRTTWLAPGQAVVFPLDPAIDRTGRMFVPWSHQREGRPSQRGFMSTRSSTWETTMLWDWSRNTYFAAADVAMNGRAVAIATSNNAQFTSTTVTMRVLHPG